METMIKILVALIIGFVGLWVGFSMAQSKILNQPFSKCIVSHHDLDCD